MRCCAAARVFAPDVCGRFAYFVPTATLLGEYQLSHAPEFQPRYNVAPTQDVVAVRQADNGAREAVRMRWGLVPHWAKDPSIGNRMINARSETVAEKPAYRQSFKHRRCIIPASGFYEWTQTAAGKWPYFISASDSPVISMAGLWARWGKDDDQCIESCTILTVAANPTLERLHARMPLCLTPSEYSTWLDPDAPLDACRALLSGNSGPELVFHPVARAVNSPRNDNAALIEQVAIGAG